MGHADRLDSIVATACEIPGLSVSDHAIVSGQEMTFTHQSVQILIDNLYKR